MGLNWRGSLLNPDDDVSQGDLCGCDVDGGRRGICGGVFR